MQVSCSAGLAPHPLDGYFALGFTRRAEGGSLFSACCDANSLAQKDAAGIPSPAWLDLQESVAERGLHGSIAVALKAESVEVPRSVRVGVGVIRRRWDGPGE